MPTLQQPSLLARLRMTSMSDLLRLRLSPGMTDIALIDASGLDHPVRNLIQTICQKSRLWPAERADVARELVAHFADGRDAGFSADGLIKEFGDPITAAKLIRAGKIRNRSLAWHVLRFLRRAVGVLVLIYLGLAVYFFLGKPRVSVDYVAKINASVPHPAEQDRAWPIYQQLQEAFGANDKLQAKPVDVDPSADERRWPRVKDWLRAHPEMLALADEAASRPAMGFVFGVPGSAYEIKGSDYKIDPNDPFFNSVMGVLLPYLNSQRAVANMLAADARLAAEDGDAERFLRRLDQLHRITRHANEPKFLVNALVAIGIESLRLDQVERLLVARPQLLSDDQLIGLAHELSIYRKPSDLITYETERDGFYDVVQRIYTDDGRGDGHLSGRGMRDMNNLLPGRAEQAFLAQSAASFALAPVTALMPSRKTLLQEYDRLMTKQEQRIDLPWRDRQNDPVKAELDKLRGSTIQSLRYVLVATFLPALDRSPAIAERFLTKRDAVQIGIALELYRRKNGHYPADLGALASQWLPSVPLDPVDGKPLRYTLVDGKPLIYSIGIDMKDNGGLRASSTRSAKKVFNRHLSINSSFQADVTGDWILFPEPDSPNDNDDAEADAAPATQPDVPQ